jgi:hypothetical protein
MELCHVVVLRHEHVAAIFQQAPLLGRKPLLATKRVNVCSRDENLTKNWELALGIVETLSCHTKMSPQVLTGSQLYSHHPKP